MLLKSSPAENDIEIPSQASSRTSERGVQGVTGVKKRAWEPNGWVDQAWEE